MYCVTHILWYIYLAQSNKTGSGGGGKVGVGETRVGGTKVVYMLYRACPFRAHSIRALLTEASFQHFMSSARSFAHSDGRNSEGEHLLLFNNRYKKFRYRTQDRLASVETCHGKSLARHT